ncbi:hypothetical protein VHEMI08106 [[Torrubiella] hemipterigena]|uniref:Uncharacterized protein n=1 Tax=[Torrubiella] hemipterigena TaxID=1531966 RepID=A0A0A1TML2_9HYPO|nr:hypothetical protein VHEMI08106 [[Torrubiella] hemipterigena]
MKFYQLSALVAIFASVASAGDVCPQELEEFIVGSHWFDMCAHIGCKYVADTSKRQGCYCKDGHKRNVIGNCVPISECNDPRCPAPPKPKEPGLGDQLEGVIGDLAGVEKPKPGAPKPANANGLKDVLGDLAGVPKPGVNPNTGL